MGDLDAALLNHKKALKLDTNNADAFYGIGRIQAVQGNLRESKISFNKAIELNPNHTATFFELSKYIDIFWRSNILNWNDIIITHLFE